MEAPKRARASPDTDSQPPNDPKRARNSEGESLSSTSDAGDDAPSYRLEGIPFPDEILALPHVLKLVDTLAMTPEEALEEAVATRQVNWVEELVDRFECTLTDAVVHAATIGLQDIVELLLNKTFGIDEEATEVEVVIDDDTGDLVEKAIVAAAQNSHLDIVKLLLPLVIGRSRRDYSSSWFRVVRSVLDAGAANGHLKVVQYMVQHAARNGYAGRYATWPSVDTLSLSILGGHADVADYLVNQSEIIWNLKQAFVTALEKGQTALADRIHEVYPQRMRGDNLFMDLAESGHLDAVKYLFISRRSDSGLIGRAFASAAQTAQIDVVKFLQVSKHGIDRGFAVAHDVAVVKLLCDNESISERAITSAFAKSLHSLSQYRIPSGIIQFLHKQPCIPAELIDEAFVQAAQALKTEIVELLRDDARLSSKAIGEVFVDAVKCRNVEMMKMLYDEKRTPPEALMKAFLEAAHRKRFDLVKDIIQLLSVEEHVPREFMHKAFIAAAQHGQITILEIIYENQPADLPLNVLKDALDVAGANAKIETFIRKLVCEQVFQEHIQGKV
ncbi:Ankyrin repeat-containing domain [Phytophthora cactorum]|nr:Ankyrin repeat-containing domain [Phytophthora cactorum]